MQRPLIRSQDTDAEYVKTSSDERAKQAVDTMGQSTDNEIKALEKLTKAGCSCTPTLLAWKHEKQDSHMWIPGGFIDYILMEKLSGICLGDVCFFSLDRTEWDEIRKHFREAWEYVPLASCLSTVY